MKGTLAVIQRYAIETYGRPGSNMEARSAYRFNRGLIAQAFSDWVGTRRFESLVDIGSSTGFLTRQLKPFARQVTAVDANRTVLSSIGDPEIRTVQDLLPDLGRLADGSADIVVTTDTLYYLDADDVQAALQRIASILRPQGYLVINDNLLANRYTGYFERWFDPVARIESPSSLKLSPNFDRWYWRIEARYLVCRGMFNALADPAFDPAADLSEIGDQGLIRMCLRHRWIRHLLPLAWPVRRAARWLWSNDWLLQRFCVQSRPSPCLSIFQRKPTVTPHAGSGA